MQEHEIRFSRELFIGKYLQYLEDFSRYEIYWGGSGSGKSFFVAQKLLYHCLNPDRKFRFLFCRKNKVDIRDSQFLLFKDLINKYDLTDYFQTKESSMDIICVNGNMLMSAGMNEPEKIKSVQQPTGVWCEEITEFDESDLNTLDLRLRAPEGAELSFIMTFNPVSEDHWIKPAFFDKEVPRLRSVHSTYIDNKFIDRAEYEKTFDRLNEHDKAIYKEGKWGVVRPGGEYLPAFDPYVIMTDKRPYKEDKPLHVSFDFNSMPYMSSLQGQVEIVDDIYWLYILSETAAKHPMNNTRGICKVIMQKYGKHPGGAFVSGDYVKKGSNTALSQEYRHEYDVIREELWPILANGWDRTIPNMPVIKRRDFLDDIFRERVNIRIRIHESCEHLKRDLLYLKQDADGQKFKEKAFDEVVGKHYEKIGHFTDNLEYLCTSLFRKFMK